MSKKLFRIEWVEPAVDEDDEPYTDVRFVIANSSEEAAYGYHVVDLKVRQATVAEAEAYTIGYEDGYDVATVEYRLEQLDMEDAIPFELDEMNRLKDKFDRGE